MPQDINDCISLPQLGYLSLQDIKVEKLGKKDPNHPSHKKQKPQNRSKKHTLPRTGHQ